jgi:MSHA biogenesis protein MshM
MYLQYFGLKHDPLGKGVKQQIKEHRHGKLFTQLNWLLETKGIGLITGEPGVGKTSGIRTWADQLNPLRYQVIYQSDNHFTAFDIYLQLADALGVERRHRYSYLYRNLKKELLHLYEDKKITPIWIIDEAHQLPLSFLTQLSAFLNFSFDTRDIMIIVLMGNMELQAMMRKTTLRALQSRILFNYHWLPIDDFQAFSTFIKSAFEAAGCVQQIMSESGMKLLHIATQGQIRQAHCLLTKSMQLACQQQLNHLPDNLIEQAIEQLQLS